MTLMYMPSLYSYFVACKFQIIILNTVETAETQPTTPCI